MIAAARDYVDGQSFITTPALKISDGYRVAAIGVGIVLMPVSVCARLTERATLAESAAAIALVLVVGTDLRFYPMLIETASLAARSCTSSAPRPRCLAADPIGLLAPAGDQHGASAGSASSASVA